ncbi:site-specific integrase [Enterococcus sp. AZ196]|uniref:site-specific integrase n=1 Tax=Enterococcus sp. AZ196 TaxID=2774659 RepID=UPI003D2944C0
MSRRGENIYKRKDRRWEGRYIKSRKKNGQIHYGYVYGRSYKETKEKLLLKKFEFRALQNQKDSQYYPGTVQNWTNYCLEKWQETVKVSTYTTYAYKLNKYILPYIGARRLTEVKRRHIKRLVQQWHRLHLSNRMIHLLYQLTQRLFLRAFKKERIPRNPCVDIHLPKQEIKKVSPLSLSEQRRLEEVAKKEKHGEAILLALHLGLRIGEVSALKWENIDFERKLLHVSETYQRLNHSSAKETVQARLALGPAKTKSSNRTIPLTDQMFQLLKEMKEKTSQRFVFQVGQKPIEPRLLTYYFHKIRKKARLVTIHFHQLRHTFATRLLESKGTIASISELLGHRSTQMTLDVYTGTVFEEKYRSLKEMEQFI